jgi:ParB family chromosome partitioning protein
MQNAYESGELRGKKLLTARKVVEARRGLGKSIGGRSKRQSAAPLTAAMMVRAYNKEVERQKHFIRKADLVQQRLAFVTAALGGLLQDEHFTNLLRAEGLASLPKVLDEMLQGSAP